MQHLVLTLEDLNETLEKFLYNQGVTLKQLEVRDCIEDIVCHLLRTPNKLQLTPLCDIIALYATLTTEEKLTIASELRNQFFFTVRDFNIQKVTAFTFIQNDLYIDGTFVEL